ncbi:MAG: VOC family protein [Candidatus Coatesbacteria bacterium]
MNKPVLSSHRMVQVGIIVRNAEESAKKYAAIFGLPVPKVSLTDAADKSHIQYRGGPTTAQAKLAFLNMESLQLELIEPVGGPSTWREFLDKKGEGVHHIAFVVPDTEVEEKTLGEHGIKLVQKGDYTGGRYAYFESEPQLAVALELLQNFGK